MRRCLTLVALLLAAAPAAAGTDAALSARLLPGFAAFRDAAAALDRAAQDDCTAFAVLPAYHAAFDAWMAVADMRIGPSESGAASIAFWPDDRGFTARMLAGLIAAEDPVVADPAAFAEVSIAGRGLFALDGLLGDPALAGYGTSDYACALVRALATDLARQAATLDDGWRTGFAAVLTSAGKPGNATYLTEREAERALYTQLLAGLEFTADVRLGRPLGSFDRPRPTRAEAWRTGRPLANAVQSAVVAAALAEALAGAALPQTQAAMARVRGSAGRIGDPALQDIRDPSARLAVESLQQDIRRLRDAIVAEVGTPMGLSPGFNSQDGD